MTLALLARADKYLSLAAVAAVLGVPRDNLYKRVKRGAPELSPEEAKKITAALRSAGIRLVKGGVAQRILSTARPQEGGTS
jgi:hypothetical protein